MWACRLLPLQKVFKKFSHASHLILTVQSSITNIVSGRPDAASISPHQPSIRPSHFLYRRIWGQTTVASLSDSKQEDKASRRGHGVLYTPWNKQVTAEKPAMADGATGGETFHFKIPFSVMWGWCCINTFITNHSQAGFAQKYHLIITCITDTSQFLIVLKVSQI